MWRIRADVFGLGQLVYLDFKPKIYKTGNDTVEYTIKTCN